MFGHGVAWSVTCLPTLPPLARLPLLLQLLVEGEDGEGEGAVDKAHHHQHVQQLIKD